MKPKTLLGESMLLISALIWGIAFVAQRVGGGLIGPFTFNGVRMLIGGLTLLPLIYLTRGKGSSNIPNKSIKQKLISHKRLIQGSIGCGSILFVASNLQQIALSHSTASKAGFLTALYIIIVPIIGIFFKRHPSITLWFSILVALIGMYLLCINDGFQIAPADILLILSALAFSVHILLIDHFSPFVDGVKLSCMQFFICGFLSSIAMFLVEQPKLSAISHAWLPLLYTGVLSCGIAYTFQILGQKRVNPVIASLIMSMESVFSALGGWLLLGESLSARELAGCILLFMAIVLAQFPIRANSYEPDMP